MSLDVMLSVDIVRTAVCQHCGKPVEIVVDSDWVYADNITHNLIAMALGAKLYKCIWHPESDNITKASQLIEPLREGLEKLRERPVWFRTYNAANGWGTYEDLLNFACHYLEACEKYPDATIHVSR